MRKKPVNKKLKTLMLVEGQDGKLRREWVATKWQWAQEFPHLFGKKK